MALDREHVAVPEGHTIHRLARRIGGDGVGHPVRASSPQGRFADGATAMDGRVLERTEAIGKHLLLVLEEGVTVHVHLGLFGKFRRRRRTTPPRGAVRLRIETHRAPWDLSGPTACALIDPAELDTLRARIGPDPLRDTDDPAPALDRMGRSRRTLGALLLDQSVISGIGNVYRAEILHALGINPTREGVATTPAERRAIWETARRMLRDGERTGRIETAEGDRRLAVYKCTSCGSCGSKIATATIANRSMFWCPECQAHETSPLMGDEPELGYPPAYQASSTRI